MTLDTWGYDTGANGDNLDSSNTGGAGLIVLTGGTSAKISTSTPMHGTRCAEYVGTSASGGVYEEHNIAATAVLGRIFIRFVGSLPSADTAVVWLGNGSSQRAHIEVTALGQLRVRDDANGAQWITAGGQSTATIVADTWYRLVYYFDMTAGQFRVAVYTGDGATPISGLDTGLRTGISLGADSYTRRRHGAKSSTSSTTVTVRIDDPAFEDAATGFNSMPYGTPPIVDAGAHQNVAAASTVTLGATASDPDGSIASYAWSFDYPTSGAPALTGSSTSTPSFTAGALGSLYILRCTVTDNDGFTASDTVEVRVPIAGATSQRVVPTNGTAVGSWTIGGGAANHGAALSDESDTTYVESPAVSASETSLRVRITPGAVKASGSLKERLWTDTGTANATLRLYEGTTLRQSWTQALTNVPTEYTFTLSSGTLAAIADSSNLYVELAVVA
ncbi:PKD domain-containing protein [Microbacterium sp. NPDC057407]|uniref:PKD domain-containing protein n=1 Tax=Microbacterium sp. NPDC057407 TaxID=3346120 RepID=UPI00366C3282